METIAHYRILERLGENRIGEIFRARDTRVGRTVALLVPGDDIQNDSERRARLLEDAQKAIAVSHPNIAALYETGEEGSRIHLVFEFVPGQTLDRVISGHPLNARRALDLATQIADALADAHAADLVHGDLTTRRVVVTPKGNAKLVDVGFARWTNAEKLSSDEAADLHALRVVLFEMLTGKVPTGPDLVAPTKLNASLPAEVDPLVSNAFGSAVVFAAELRAVAAVLETRAEGAQKSLRVPARRPRRSKIPWIAATMTAAAMAAAAAWWLLRR